MGGAGPGWGGVPHTFDLYKSTSVIMTKTRVSDIPKQPAQPPLNYTGVVETVSVGGEAESRGRALSEGYLVELGRPAVWRLRQSRLRHHPPPSSSAATNVNTPGYLHRPI